MVVLPEHIGSGVLLLPLVGPGRLVLLVLHADLVVAEEAVLTGVRTLHNKGRRCISKSSSATSVHWI